MNYAVNIMPAAEAELEEAYNWLAARSPQHGPLWYNGLLDAVLSLEFSPARCPLAPESQHAPESIRQLLYGTRQHAYRILFTIRGETVTVLHIRHGARASQ
jgi:plasmid stabilization system protein ParE